MLEGAILKKNTRFIWIVFSSNVEKFCKIESSFSTNENIALIKWTIPSIMLFTE